MGRDELEADDYAEVAHNAAVKAATSRVRATWGTAEPIDLPARANFSDWYGIHWSLFTRAARLYFVPEVAIDFREEVIDALRQGFEEGLAGSLSKINTARLSVDVLINECRAVVPTVAPYDSDVRAMHAMRVFEAIADADAIYVNKKQVAAVIKARSNGQLARFGPFPEVNAFFFETAFVPPSGVESEEWATLATYGQHLAHYLARFERKAEGWANASRVALRGFITQSDGETIEHNAVALVESSALWIPSDPTLPSVEVAKGVFPMPVHSDDEVLRPLIEALAVGVIGTTPGPTYFANAPEFARLIPGIEPRTLN